MPIATPRDAAVVLARPDLIDPPEWLSPSVFPFAMKALDVDGARLTYLDEGTGPTLVFAPGSPMWSFMFRTTVRILRPHFRCVAVDLPGLGLSRVPLHRGQAFARSADWLQGFVHTLGLERFTLAVHATAGPPALEMAVRERHRIDGLVVTNSFAWPLTDVPKFSTFIRILNSAPIAFANTHAGIGLLPWVASRFGRRTRPFTPEERVAVAGPFRSGDARRHLQNVLLGLRVERAFFAEVERRITALRDLPALLLYGTHDNGYKLGFLERWKRLLPNHTAVLLDRSDHFAPEDQAEDYTAAVAGWWFRTIGQGR